MRKATSKGIFQFAEIIRNVEARVFGKPSIDTPYIQTPAGQRYLKAVSPRRNAARSTLNHTGNPDLSRKPRTFSDRVKWAKRRLFNSFDLPCQADIVLLRKHLNLFYFDHGLRIKIEAMPPEREEQSLAREFEQRKKVESMGSLNVPPLVGGQVDSQPYFFMDELIDGTVLTWKGSNAQDTFRRLIPELWKYYQHMGIQWPTPLERGHDIGRLIREYENALNAYPDIRFPFDLNELSLFQNQRVPCSEIHGDLVIHNIIVSRKGDYLLDWESSAFDYLMRDFHRLLIIDGWSLHRDIAPLMEAEVDVQRSKGGGEILTFNEQLYFILFLEVHKMLTTAHYPSRLLRKAQAQLESFFSSLTVPAHLNRHE